MNFMFISGAITNEIPAVPAYLKGAAERLQEVSVE